MSDTEAARSDHPDHGDHAGAGQGELPLPVLHEGTTGSGPVLRVSNPPAERPLVIYDGDCSFCRFWLLRLRRGVGDRADYAPSQRVAAEFPEIPQEHFRRALQLILPDGRVFAGAEAVFRLQALAPPAHAGNGALKVAMETAGSSAGSSAARGATAPAGPSGPSGPSGWLWAYGRVPGARTVFELGYRWVAGHRNFLYKLTTAFFGSAPPGRELPALGQEPSPEPDPEVRRRRVMASAALLGAGAALLLSLAVILKRRRR